MPVSARAVLPMLVGIAVLTACGGAIAPTSDASPSSTPRVQSTPSEGSTPAPAGPPCPDDVEAFLVSLEELDSRLTIGMNQDEYGSLVGAANVLHDRIDGTALSLECLNDVAVPAEEALQLYADANNTWNDCIVDPDCTNDSITAELQAKWAEATEKITAAREAQGR